MKLPAPRIKVGDRVLIAYTTDNLHNQHVYEYWCTLMSNPMNDAYDYLFYRQQIDNELRRSQKNETTTTQN